MTNSTLGQRLKSERRRLKFTQQSLAKALGVSPGSQTGYEADARVPDAKYLSAAQEIGMDAMYVFTGKPIEQIAIEKFDWEKHALILQYVEAWLSDHNLYLPSEKKSEVIKLFMSILGPADRKRIEQTLSLVA